MSECPICGKDHFKPLEWPNTVTRTVRLDGEKRILRLEEGDNYVELEMDCGAPEEIALRALLDMRPEAERDFREHLGAHKLAAAMIRERIGRRGRPRGG